MPRWAGALIMLVFGGYALFFAFWEDAFYMHPFGRLPTWAGRTFHIILGVALIIGAFLLIYDTGD